jgi:hypothetical protein
VIVNFLPFHLPTPETYLGWGSSKPKSNISIIPFITWAEQ